MLAPEGRIILFTLLITTLTAGMIGFYYDSERLLVCYAVFGLLFLFSCNFFRDPVRSIPMDESSIVAPADGKIIRIDQVNDSEIGEGANRISIFLSVFNVHVNRVPITCTVKDVKHIPGKFLAAYDHKASDENEKTDILFSGDEYYLSCPSDSRNYRQENTLLRRKRPENGERRPFRIYYVWFKNRYYIPGVCSD